MELNNYALFGYELATISISSVTTNMFADQGHPTDLLLQISVLMKSPAGSEEKGNR